MDWTALAQTVSTVGFPILACCYMFHIYDRQNQTHKEETNKLVEAINELKLALNTLIERLDK